MEVKNGCYECKDSRLQNRICLSYGIYIYFFYMMCTCRAVVGNSAIIFLCLQHTYDYNSLTINHADCLFVLGLFAKEYCLYESFSAECPGSNMIVITSAIFGFMGPGKCISQDLSKI